jgi:hypothetical protein
LLSFLADPSTRLGCRALVIFKGAVFLFNYPDLEGGTQPHTLGSQGCGTPIHMLPVPRQWTYAPFSFKMMGCRVNFARFS